MHHEKAGCWVDAHNAAWEAIAHFETEDWTTLALPAVSRLRLRRRTDRRIPIDNGCLTDHAASKRGLMQIWTVPATINGFTDHAADVNRTRLHYRIGGNASGTPVLLWHGFLATGYVWRKVGPLLAQRCCSVLIPDMRGYGDSAKPSDPSDCDARNLVADSRELVKAISFGTGRSIVLVVHDMVRRPHCYGPRRIRLN